MKDNVNRVMNGFLNLSDNDKRDFAATFSYFQKADIYDKRVIVENIRSSVTKLDSGPIGDTCECCGR